MTAGTPRDPLADIEPRLAGLDDQPVQAHADALEQVHRTVVAELERLAGVGKPANARADGDP